MNNLSSTTNSAKIKYKIVLLGDQSVGKSSIIEKFIHNKFDENMSSTVGIDFLAKNLNYKSKSYRLQLWDTAGQQRFKSLIPSYLKDAICAIIVFDCTNIVSLKNAQKWLAIYNESKPINGYSILVGNKIDLDYRTVSKQQGQSIAQGLQIDYFELSAKTGQNVDNLFYHLIDMFSEGKSNGTNNILDNIKQLPQQIRYQQNAIDDQSNSYNKQQKHKAQQSSQLIPQSKLDSIQQLHQQHLQKQLQPKIQQNIILNSQPIANPIAQQRPVCC